MKRHPLVVVCQGETMLGEVLHKLGEGAERAVLEGRVFIGTRRASGASEPLEAGDQVVMYPARDGVAEAPRILADREGILAFYKPAGMPTVADQRGKVGTLEHEAAKLVGAPDAKMFPTSRLDVGVSGVVLFATDESARTRLQRARTEGRYRRHYVAIAAGVPVPSRGLWTAPIGRDRDPRRRRAFGRDAVPAETAYEVVATTPKGTLLAVEPKTGRTHQIRVHAAHAGHPLLGDAAYGGLLRIVSERGSVRVVGRIALHAGWVEVPGQGAAALRVDAAVPDDLAAIWTACGGDASAWDLAYEPLEST
jgi:23S rRNA pseudouridine1911/1915/1917 synthase